MIRINEITREIPRNRLIVEDEEGYGCRPKKKQKWQNMRKGYYADLLTLLLLFIYIYIHSIQKRVHRDRESVWLVNNKNINSKSFKCGR